MLSQVSRILTTVTAAGYLVLGAPLFLAPSTLAPSFAWNVSPFVAMTIGAWCLGNAWLAWITARRWRGRLVYASLAYLGFFGAFELAVLVAFREKLVLVHPVAWLYLAALILSLGAALAGLAQWLPTRAAREAFGPPVQRVHRAFIIAFIVFVGFLAAYGLLAPLGAPGTNAGIFPEVMSLFTLRSFAAFYLALTLGVVVLLRELSLPALLHHSFASFGLIVTITAAAVVHLRLFDFLRRPGGLLYFAAYLAVGVLVLAAFRTYGTGGMPESETQAATP